MRNDGRPFRTRYHTVWDEKVRVISGGLTIMPVGKGQWVHEDQVFKERMIPVQLLATEAEMNQIVDMSIVYYDQIAIMAYEISRNVILRYRDEKKTKRI